MAESKMQRLNDGNFWRQETPWAGEDWRFSKNNQPSALPAPLATGMLSLFLLGWNQQEALGLSRAVVRF